MLKIGRQLFSRATRRQVNSLNGLNNHLRVNFNGRIIRLVCFGFDHLLIGLIGSLRTGTLATVTVFISLVSGFIVTQFGSGNRHFMRPVNAINVSLNTDFLMIN